MTALVLLSLLPVRACLQGYSIYPDFSIQWQIAKETGVTQCLRIETRASSECPKDMSKKTADSLIFFSNSDQWCFVHGLSIGKMPRSTGEGSN